MVEIDITERALKDIIYYHVVSEKLVRIITINFSGLPLDFEKLRPN
ncbi:MAG TPA: hypothetical protein PK228_13950 [Saprospiraceae bacterium]|nr:hypothetical protein [Saprospiraceae bacterium]